MDDANAKLLDAASIQEEGGIPEALSPKDTWISDDDDSESGSTCSSKSEPSHTHSDSEEALTVTPAHRSRCQRILQRIPCPRALFKIFLVIGFVVTIAVLFVKFKGKLIALPYHWAQSKGVLGGVYVSAFLVVYVVCGLPVTFMELLCGFMFGFGYGLLVGTIGKQLGAMAGFAIGRKVLMKRSAKLRERYIFLQAIELALKEAPHKMTWLIAVAYVPEAIKVYGLSLFDSVGFWYYTVVMGVTGIPYSLVTTWIGSSSQNLLQVINNEGGGENRSVSATSLALLVVGVVCAIAILILFGYYGMKARRRIMARLNAEEDVTRQIEDDIESAQKSVEKKDSSTSRSRSGVSSGKQDRLKPAQKDDFPVRGEFSASSVLPVSDTSSMPFSGSCSSTEDVTSQIEDDIESAQKSVEKKDSSTSRSRSGLSGGKQDRLKPAQKDDFPVRGAFSASSYASSVLPVSDTSSMPNSGSCSSTEDYKTNTASSVHSEDTATNTKSSMLPMSVFCSVIITPVSPRTHTVRKSAPVAAETVVNFSSEVI